MNRVLARLPSVFGALTALLYLAGHWIDLPPVVRSVCAAVVFAALPGWLLVRWLLPRCGRVRALALALALTPVLVTIGALGRMAGLGWPGFSIIFSGVVAVVALLRLRAVRPEAERFTRPQAIGSMLAVALTLAVMFPSLTSLKVRAGTHGSLHSAIVQTLSDRGIPPENPYFAGERLLYYWHYHLSIESLARAGGWDPLWAFALSNTFYLLAFLLLLQRMTVVLFGSERAGPLGMALAFLALNPFGWLFFIFQNREDTFADVGSMNSAFYLYRHLVGDWDTRASATLTKFLNVSSAPASMTLAVLVMLAVCALVRAKTDPGEERDGRGWAVVLALALAGCFVFLPLIAVGLVPPIGAALAVVIFLVWSGRWPGDRRGILLAIAALAVGGLSAVLATLPLMSAALQASEPSIVLSVTALHWRGLVGCCGVAAPLGVAGAVQLLRKRRLESIPVIFCGVGLAAFALGLRFPVANEYKFIRLLVLPLGVLGGGPVLWLWGLRRRWRIATAVGLTVLFVPTNALAAYIFYAYARGDPRFAVHDRTYSRLPEDDPLSLAQAWIRENTPRDAVILDNPAIRQSRLGQTQHNEVVFFTGRTLFTEGRFYLTERYGALEDRLELCRSLFAGRPLTADQLERLAALGRPLYLLVRWPARNSELERSLRSTVESIRGQPGFKEVFGRKNAWVFKLELD